jgi:tRNA(Phe) wybutosine-synthesizing methylase Tyw3
VRRKQSAGETWKGKKERYLILTAKGKISHINCNDKRATPKLTFFSLVLIM